MHVKVYPPPATILSQIFPFCPIYKAIVRKDQDSLNEGHICIVLPRIQVSEASTTTKKCSIRNIASPACDCMGLKCIAMYCQALLYSLEANFLLLEPVKSPGARARGSVNQDIYWVLDLTSCVVEP